MFLEAAQGKNRFSVNLAAVEKSFAGFLVFRANFSAC